MGEDNQGRKIPLNELDFNSQLANPLWGQDWENPEIRNLLINTKIKTDEHGLPLYHEEIKEENGQKVWYRYIVAEEKSEYETLSFITRDFRLGNLSRFNGEYDYCRKWARIAHGVLQMGLKKSHTCALARLAIDLELSQSRGGFFRKTMNTLFEEMKTEELEPRKRSMFGSKKSKGEY